MNAPNPVSVLYLLSYPPLDLPIPTHHLYHPGDRSQYLWFEPPPINLNLYHPPPPTFEAAGGDLSFPSGLWQQS